MRERIDGFFALFPAAFPVYSIYGNFPCFVHVRALYPLFLPIADTMITKCANVSTDFSHVEIGEALWCEGHIGVYIGNGQSVL